MSAAWRRWQKGLCGLVLGLALAAVPAFAGTTQRIVTDPTSGLALWGYDPVAYFVEGGPRPGRQAHELAHSGAVWRFACEGNRAAFDEAPATYLPAFGGHDPSAAARGNAVPGNPEVFAIWNGRVYLFRDESSRERFLADPASAARLADIGWVAAEKLLAR